MLDTQAVNEASRKGIWKAAVATTDAMRFTFDLRVYLLSTMSYRIVLEVDSAVKLRGAGGEGR